jgi:hypothetical protein
MIEMTADAGRGDDRKSIGRELRRGSLELIVLHLLAAGEAYGYEIVTKLTSPVGFPDKAEVTPRLSLPRAVCERLMARGSREGYPSFAAPSVPG